jgi:hypothetical protein
MHQKVSKIACIHPIIEINWAVTSRQNNQYGHFEQV